MIRHRSGIALEKSDDESSSDDDVFCASSRKRRMKRRSFDNLGIAPTSSRTVPRTSNVVNDTEPLSPGKEVIHRETSSNKRHHHQSSQRAANMDAWLQELEETPLASKNDVKQKAPDKLGSYCLPGEEDSTTNIFVGANLSPLTTEEQLADLFRQFGELYSVKIMWPRTPEEQARGRNSGFVCFYEREDAQDAMDTLQGSDPFGNGRKMFLNWGKNVKKVVKRGAGGVPIPLTQDLSHDGNPIRKNVDRGSSIEDPTTQNLSSIDTFQPSFDPNIHLQDAIHVVPPPCPMRAAFITTVASFVAKDGSGIENKLMEAEKNNPIFSFLRQRNDGPIDEDIENERIFYRWRIFAFKNGDGDVWRVEPFMMVQPEGVFWIPPPMDPNLSKQRAIEDKLRKKQVQLLQKQRRNMIAARKGFAAGKLEKSYEHISSHNMLNAEQLERWYEIIESLTCAREMICEAMAFCFDHSVAAQHISQLLKTALLDSRHGVSVETKCARLFLMSDILFNSQQGVKHAFRYRDVIEEMAPEVFRCLGQHTSVSGRISMNKLHAATRKVLKAWDSWSVYNPAFLDELELLFEGKTSSRTSQNDMLANGIQIQDDTIDETVCNTETKSSSIWMGNSQMHMSDHKKYANKFDLVTEIDNETPGGTSEINPATLINEDLDGESMGGSEIYDSSDENEGK